MATSRKTGQVDLGANSTVNGVLLDNGGWTDGGSIVVHTTTPTDAVGIGTSTPTAGTKVEIVASSGGFANGLGILSGTITVPGSALNSQRYGPSTLADGAGATVLGVGATSATGATNTVVVGHLASVAANFTDTVAIGNSVVGGLRSVVIGPNAHSSGNDDVSIGAGPASTGAGTIAIGEACAAGGFGNLAIGIGSNADGIGANCIGPGARNYRVDRITHAQTYQDNTFVSGHLGTEMNNVYFGGGMDTPTTAGRFAKTPPNAVVRGTNGYFFTAIPNPENFAASGTAPTATSANVVGGTLIPSQTFKIAIGYVNKEEAGETLLNSPYSVTIGGGHNAILVQNLNAGAANVQDGVDEQIDHIMVYMEDVAGSGNLYLIDRDSTGGDVTLLAPPPNTNLEGYLALVSQIPVNTTASDGQAWSIGVAGGNVDPESTQNGGNSFITSGLPADSLGANSGSVTVFSADTDGLTTEGSGDVSVRTGQSNTTSGGLFIHTGTGNAVGNITISTPAPLGGPGNGGQIRVDCAGDGITVGTTNAQLLAFWGAAPVAQQVSVALTNNVTAGGVSNVIADVTNGVTYATDYPTIRSNFYQLARKLKEISDAMHTIGLLG